jgi:hypothetical protein
MNALHPTGVFIASAFSVASLLWWLFSGITGGGE